MSQFVHLHLHSQYSFLDSSIHINELVERCVSMNMPAVALTDHDSMLGALDFFKKTTAADIKPILGYEPRIAKVDASDEEDNSQSQIVLLAKNQTGYRNLCRLNHLAYSTGYALGVPRLDTSILSEHSDGLIMLTGNLAGDIPQLLLRDEYDAAREQLKTYQDIFGAENVFLEITDQGIAEQRLVNGRIVELARKADAPLVATNDVHYLDPTHARSHEVLMAIQLGRMVDWDDANEKRPTGFHLASAEEMAEKFSELPEALENTLKIAEMCDVHIGTGTYYLPKYDCPEGKSLGEVLTEMAEAGLDARIEEITQQKQTVDNEEYADRLKYELEIIESMEFPGYFLTVADYVQWARNNRVPVGPGRGSGAGSLVAYALRITDIDPIRYGLLFERFLNPERVSMPDFDVDFCQQKRQDVIEYAIEKYGSENVAQIITYGSMKAKAVVRDVARALGMTPQEGDRIAKLIPTDLGITLESAYDKEKRLRELLEEDERYKRLFDVALELEGLYRQAGIHASALVISDAPLWHYMPTTRGNNGELMTQYAMNETEEVGLVKFDFLGLKTLTVLDHAERLVQEHLKADFRLDDLGLDDSITYKLMSSGNTLGVFQLESSGFQELLRKLRPDCFEDVVAAVALYRPGPLGSGMVDDFVKRKHGQTPVEYPHPDLEESLRETYGVIVYQEQVMQIASILAGFSLGQADLLRRAMGKKKEKEMKRMRDIFLEGATKNNVSSEKANSIFDLMAYFAGYGFNKSHSAAYAVLTYQTGYLKAHYPAAFFAAMLTSESNRTEKVVRYVYEARRMGIDVLPPDVNESAHDFTLVERAIRFGLSAVKGVGDAAIEAIIHARNEEGPFTSLTDFCGRVDLRCVNKRTIEALVSCGAFDSMGLDRDIVLNNVSRAIESGTRYQQDKALGQFNLFGGEGEEQQLIDIEYAVPEERFTQRQRLRLEKDALGFYLTGHPLEGHAREVKDLGGWTTADIEDRASDGDNILVGGIAAEIRERRSRNGDRMAILQFEDLSGRVEVVVFPRTFAACETNLSDDLPIVVQGRVRIEESEESRIVSIIADSIITLASFRLEKAKGVTLELSSETGEDQATQLISNVGTVLTKHPGPVPVYASLRLEGSGRIALKLDGKYQVSPTDEFLSELRDIDEVTTIVTSAMGPAS
ncbi:MAG: DNA polymerase III subunit alpha [Myxococcales bacterium]|nr:DNA polymerase III subunit alpha [Myxococcales bacterium]|tara:strand:- start:3544 stop:7029 length:3486 start_codon:yes stop_codon:yes gene_type:complete